MLTRKDRRDKYKVIQGTFKRRADSVRKLKEFYGTWTELGKRAGLSASFLIAIAGENPRRTIGEKLARDIEHALKLQANYLDQSN